MDAVVVAAGAGRRFGMPKALVPLAGRPLVLWSVAALRASGSVESVVVVGREEDLPALRALPLGPRVAVAAGGERRQDSVRLGLEALGPSREGVVLVHDAARPLVTPALILRVAEAAGEAVVPVIPVPDTVKRIGADGEVATLDRRTMVLSQTPQRFPKGDLLERLRAAPAEVTDEVQFYEAEGRVTAVEGDPQNLKVTRPEDLATARALLSDREGPAVRVGHGYDVHPTVLGGGPMMLGGVAIPSDVGLLGHSDADVLLHAVADAVLGASGLPDIGHMFPPGSPKTRGMPSATIIREAVRAAAARGLRPWQADATLALESPRLAPHREAILSSLAELLELPVDRVNVKATTEEGLDDVGRGLGVRAWAVVLLRTL